MNFNFELILFYAVAFTAFLSLLSPVVIRQKNTLVAKFVLEGKSYFPVLLAVLILRSFVIQFHYVPTGSLEPTLLPGDFVATNQFAYGLRLPVINKKIMSLGLPRTGDIAVFRAPDDSKLLVKRVIGLPGDRIIYKDKRLMINGVEALQTSRGVAFDQEPEGNIPVDERIENLLGKHHAIFVRQEKPENDFDVIVPPGHYFMMGDNRDNSADSRYFGFVPEENLCGKAFGIFASWNGAAHSLRWGRIGRRL